jgi:hypothetical protein
VWIVALAIVLAGSLGCSDSAKTADPKPVNVKDDPRIKRTISGGENNPGGQLTGIK